MNAVNIVILGITTPWDSITSLGQYYLHGTVFTTWDSIIYLGLFFYLCPDTDAFRFVLFPFFFNPLIHILHFSRFSSYFSGQLSIGNLTSFALYSSMVGLGFASLSQVYGELIKASSSANRVFEIIDRPAPSITAGDSLSKVRELRLGSERYPWAIERETQTPPYLVHLLNDRIARV